MLAARSLDRVDLGAFALAIAAIQLLVYLSDLGLTSLVMRQVARSGSLDWLKWNLGRRSVVVVVAAPPVVMIFVRDAPPSFVMLILLTALANSWYSALIAALFSLERSSRVVGTQFANGLCFSLLGVGVFFTRPSVEAFVGVVLASYFLLIVANLELLFQVRRAVAVPPSAVGQLPFIVSGLAYGIGSSVDSLLIGSQSKIWLAQYASAQRVGLGVAAVNRAASNLLLPRFARDPAIFKTGRLVVAFVGLCAAGSAIGIAVTPAANALYDADLVLIPVVALLFAAYTADLLLVSVSANLVAKGLERGLAVVACAQTVTMLLGASIFLNHGPAAVAAAVLAGRVVGFTLMVRLERRSSPAGA